MVRKRKKGRYGSDDWRKKGKVAGRGSTRTGKEGREGMEQLEWKKGRIEERETGERKRKDGRN